MLRVVAHKSAAAARKYFSEALSREDYYSEKQEVVGKWHGKAAQLLGLSGDVTPQAFAALVENQHPETGKRLTARTDRDRIPGYDLNFNAPKNLSVLQALTGDKDIVRVFRESVAETMGEIETQIATRVRKGGAQTNRVTGDFAWAEFVHFTARPVDGIPDCHLHVHGFVFNATHDFVEGRWKAANFREIKKDAPYFAAAFHARLTVKLAALGYGIERTVDGWDISGIPQSVKAKFSRRTAQIEELAKQKGITDPKAKDALGAMSREKKRHDISHADLLAEWNGKLSLEEKAAILKVHKREQPVRGTRIDVALAFEEACQKVFARSSIVETKRLIAEVLHFGVGHITPENAWHEFRQRKMVVKEIDGEQLCTSIEVLAEEVALLNWVRSGRGMCAPLGVRNQSLNNSALSAEQRAAVRHILNSRDQVIAVRGAAGVGKTTSMIEAVAQIEAFGRRVFAFAPSADASRGTLRKAGFPNADTVAALLVNPKLQEKIRGQIIWIDEAGQIGAGDLWKIMQVAGDSTRIILTGDTAQHAPVPRGDAFRLLQHYAGLRIAQLTEIRRQEGVDYRNVVAALSKGDLRTAFRRLDDLDAIIEIANDAERYRELAQDFLALSRGKHIPLVVSPTHAEGAKCTAAIREAKREVGQLGRERSFTRYHDLRWEEPDRRRVENYREGLVVQFHQNVSGIQRGEVFRVAGQDQDGAVMIENAHRTIPLPLKDAGRFRVFEERRIDLAPGDRIRITNNGNAADGRRLNNGQLYSITKFGRGGTIILNTGATLAANHGHLDYGYVNTSHASQSKSVKDVLVAQSSDSFLASSREQFYVSVSRGKETIRIYTDSRRELEAAVGYSSTRRAGVELAGFTKAEVGALVSGEAAQQWRERVRKHQADKTSQSHVEKLLAARKIEGGKKPDNMDHRQFLVMKAALSGADGKNRSKGHPSGAGKKTGNKQNQYRSFARPTQLTTSTREKLAAAAEKRIKTDSAQKKPMHPRREQLMKAFQSAKTRLAKVVNTMKDKVKAVKDKALPKQSPEQAAKRAEQRRTKQTSSKVKAKTQTRQKPLTPPGPKRGK